MYVSVIRCSRTRATEALCFNTQREDWEANDVVPVAFDTLDQKTSLALDGKPSCSVGSFTVVHVCLEKHVR